MHETKQLTIDYRIKTTPPQFSQMKLNEMKGN